jgi:hypothetical protein
METPPWRQDAAEFYSLLTYFCHTSWGFVQLPSHVNVFSNV